MVNEKPENYLNHVVFASHSGLAEQIQIISSYIRFYLLFCFEKIPSSSHPGFLVGFFLPYLSLQPILLSLRRGQSSVSYAQSLAGAPETRLSALDNGLRIASEETGHATCTVRTQIYGC